MKKATICFKSGVKTTDFCFKSGVKCFYMPKIQHVMLTINWRERIKARTRERKAEKHGKQSKYPLSICFFEQICVFLA